MPGKMLAAKILGRIRNMVARESVTLPKKSSERKFEQKPKR